MPIREYKCPECGLLDEHILNGEPPVTLPCRRCQAPADLKRMPSSIALNRSSMDNAPLDNFIGKDAEKKWDLLASRQKARDGIRVAAQTQGLSAVAIGPTGADAYQPITPKQKTTRTDMVHAIEATGHGKTLPLPGDSKK